jgi:site-specific DNA recombinase
VTKRSILYCRVSTDEQATNYSLSTQLEACRQYALSHDMEIVAEYSDDYTGAVPLELRPEGRKAYSLLTSGQADVLVVYRMDRLVRPPEDGDEWDTPILIRSLAKTKKEIHTCDRGPLQTDFASLLIATLDARSAGEERRRIMERTSRGRLAKARSGKVVGNGHPPYGYINVGGSLTVVNSEALVVQEIYRLYTVGHLTMYKIARELERRGIPAPHSKYKAVAKPDLWSRSAVWRILRSRVYAGEWIYGLRSDSGKDFDIVVDVTPLVDRETWFLASQIADYNAEISGRNRQQTYLLSGMVRCSCGFSMCIRTTATNRFYYCSSRSSRQAKATGHKCQQHQVQARTIEEAAWTYIKDLLSGDFESELREAQEVEREAAGAGRGKLDAIEAMLADVEKQAKNLAVALRSASGIVLATLSQEATKISEQHRQLLARKRELERQHEAAGLSAARVESLLEFRERVIRGLDRATEADKRRYFEILQVRVTVKGDEIQVSCVIESHSSSTVELNRVLVSAWLACEPAGIK